MIKRSYLVTAGKYGLGFAGLAFVVWKNWAPADGHGLSEVRLADIQIQPLSLACLIFFVSLLLSFARWYVLVRALDLPFTAVNAVRLGLIGFFWSTFFPGSVGGDVVKAYYISREQKRRSVAVATVLLDRAVGLWGLFWFVALLGSFFWLSGDLDHQPRLLFIVQGALALVAFTSVLWGVYIVLPERRGEKFAWRLGRIPKIGGAVSEFWRAVWMYRGRQGAIVWALLLSLIGHIGWVTSFYFSAQMFLKPMDRDSIPSLTEHFMIVPVGMTIQALFPTPGGLGGGEYGFGALYGLIGKPEAAGVMGSLGQRVISWSIALFGYIVYLRMPRAERVEGTWSGTEVAKPSEKEPAASPKPQAASS